MLISQIEKKRILFLGYWNLDDGLTHSTIFPHLQILKKIKGVEYLHFANTQREEPSVISLEKINQLNIDYSPLYSKNLALNHFNKVYDFIHFPKLIQKLCVEHQINLIIGRGAPAGSLAYLATKKNKIPFVVESFEPHADYMKAAGEWKAYDLRYIFQKKWEGQQKKYAKALVTVAQNYRNLLIKDDIDRNKIFVAPCAVEPSIFYMDESLRREVRLKLNIPDTAIVGVYAGKFGGLYLEEQAFKIFKHAFGSIKDFYLLLLSKDTIWLKNQIKKYKLPSNRIFIKYVSYDKVNNYLNTADFAFALYKSNRVSPFLSPVKLGEYWACGLPVLITPNLGDEMHWIKEKGLGDIIEDNEGPYFSEILKFSKTKIIENGLKMRRMNKINEVYNQILN